LTKTASAIAGRMRAGRRGAWRRTCVAVGATNSVGGNRQTNNRQCAAATNRRITCRLPCADRFQLPAITQRLDRVVSTFAACACGASIQTSRGSAGSRTHPIVPSGITRRTLCGDRSRDCHNPGTIAWERVPPDFVSPSCVALPSCRLPLRRPFRGQRCDGHRRALLVKHQFQSAHPANVDMSQARR